MSTDTPLKAKPDYEYMGFVDAVESRAVDFEHRVVLTGGPEQDASLLVDQTNPKVIEAMLDWCRPTKAMHWGPEIHRNYRLSAALIAHAHSIAIPEALLARFHGFDLAELIVAHATCVLGHLPTDARWAMSSADVRADVSSLMLTQATEDPVVKEQLERQVVRIAERYLVPRLVIATLPNGRQHVLASDQHMELRQIVPAHLGEGIKSPRPLRIAREDAGRLFGPHFEAEDQIVRFRTIQAGTTPEGKSASDIERGLRGQVRDQAATPTPRATRCPSP